MRRSSSGPTDMGRAPRRGRPAWASFVRGCDLGVAGPSRDSDGHVGVCFEAAAVIVTLVLLCQVMEPHAREGTKRAMLALQDTAAKTARAIRADATEAETAREVVAVGDRPRVRPDDKEPVDGVVVDDRSSVDESMISDEPVPFEKTEGDAVNNATIIGTGSLVIRATRFGADTTLSFIVEMLANAQHSRADP